MLIDFYQNLSHQQMEVVRPLVKVLSTLGGNPNLSDRDVSTFRIGKVGHPRRPILAAASPLQDVAATIHQEFKTIHNVGTSQIGPYLKSLAAQWKRSIYLVVIPNKCKTPGVLDKPSAYPKSDDPYVDNPLWGSRIAIIFAIKHDVAYHFVQWTEAHKHKVRSFLTLEDLLEGRLATIVGSLPKESAAYQNLGNVFVTILKRLPPSVKALFSTA